MAHPTVVILIAGLNDSLIGERSPRLKSYREHGSFRRLKPMLPAVTCSVQASMATGLRPDGHGIVANGWYNREQAEVQFWKQSNHLVQGEKIWDAARKRDPDFTCANMFWWFNMYSSVDYSVTPRPIYKADGRKIPDVYTNPSDLRDRLQSELGTFPLFNFWGPTSNIKSSQWIAEASIRVHQWHKPTLTLIYLPHLDYALQKIGPEHPDIRKEVAAIDSVAGGLLDYFDGEGHRTVLLSEYGIEPVVGAIAVNRALRAEGLLSVREEQGHELLDAGASPAFAVADHQIAHVYVKRDADIARVKELCEALPGVEMALDRGEQPAHGIGHARAGELVLVSDSSHWFTYDYWLDDRRAPDFARTVDIHRKPGYDPRELFLDPEISFPKLKIASKLLRKKIGMRTLLDVIPLDASLVKGSHGRIGLPDRLKPILMTAQDFGDYADEIECAAVHGVILDQLFSE